MYLFVSIITLRIIIMMVFKSDFNYAKEANMIRITWNNLIPPGYQSEDIVKYLLKPAIFDNPELKEKIKTSAFYEREQRGKTNNFYTYLVENKTARTRLFSRTQNPLDSKSISERMLHLLLENTTSKGIPYNMNSFPIRHEFKRQWMKVLTPIEKLTAEERKHLEPDKNDQYTLNGRRILKESDIELYCEYICDILKVDIDNKNLKENGDSDDLKENGDSDNLNKNNNLSKLKKNLDKWSAGNRIKRDFENVDVQLHYREKQISLYSLIKDIPSCDGRSKYYKDDEEFAQLSEEKNLFFERIASLSVIASIWYIWENATDKNTYYQEELFRIANMLFPSESLSIFNTSNQTTAISSHVDENDDTKQAYGELQKIKAKLGSHEFNSAGELCEKIFCTYKNASDEIMAKTLSHLIMCCENGYPVPAYFGSIKNIIREAIYYGSSYISKEKTEIKNHPLPSNIDSDGTYTLNCDYESSICDWIIHTAPPKWHKIISEAPESTLVSNQNQRILLVNDDYSLNLRDAINILDKIKSSITQGETSISDWQNLDLYIRCHEAEITPLLDTALSYFTEDSEITSQSGLKLIKIYLIDEAKRSADFLFARHPHFYPLTLARNTGNDTQCVHIVLATDNKNLKYSEWLIKEAFWTLPRFDANVKSKISIISPYATELYHLIISQCPGLASILLLNGKMENPGARDIKAKITDINFPDIEFTHTSFSSQALQAELEKLWNPSEYLYYIVDSSSDTEGISLAIKIREHTVRQSVLTGHSNNYSKYNATIAVRCFDPDIAGLVNELIVPKEEEHGKQWFNDYNLIPFGTKESIYSWDQLSGGIIETVSQCIHLQYCKASLDNNSCNKELNSYFKRLYNRDSSFGAAVSIPYRLYEAGVFPDSWFIQNSDAWWNKKIRKELASNYKAKITSNKRLIEQLARYEHMRWCCFQLTRGWLPVDSNRVIQFMSSGVKRHVLQIAKLHPCLCSWDDLIDLHRQLSVTAMRKINWKDYESFKSREEIEPYLDKRFSRYFSFEEIYTYFQEVDNTNIEQTDLIIETAWDIEGEKNNTFER